MSKTIQVLMLVALLCALCAVCGCAEQGQSGASGPLSTSYQEGFETGYDMGYVQGDFDYERDNEQDNTPPRPQGDYDNDYNTGFSTGYKGGYEDGWGARLAQNPLFQKGFQDGFRHGADKGYMDYMKEDIASGYTVDVSGEGYKNYRIGFKKGAEEGYVYGVELARNGETPPQDWYAKYTASPYQEDAGYSTQDKSQNTWQLSWFADGVWDWHNAYGYFSLHIYADYDAFMLEMIPESSEVTKFIDYGTCSIDEEKETMTLVIAHTEYDWGPPEGIIRPEQFTKKQVWHFDYTEASDKGGPLKFTLVDPAGDKYSGLDCHRDHYEYELPPEQY